MKASDLLKKTTITPDDDPRSKLRDEEEEEEKYEDEQELEDDDEKAELDLKEEEEVREHETFKDEESASDDEALEADKEESGSISKDEDDELLDEEEEEELDTKDEVVEPKHTFKREADGGPTPKYHNIAGFAAVNREAEPGFEPEEIEEAKREDAPSVPRGETLDDLAAMPEESVDEEPMQRRTADLDEENMDIPNLKSQHMPSSGIYTSHNGAQREFSTFSPPPRRGKSKNLLLQLVVLALIGLSVIGGTVYALKMQFNGLGGDQASPSPSLEAILPSPTPSPSPEVKIDRSEYTVRVLNGTSTSGLAASVLAELKELGYQTDRAGNATNSAFTQTQIRIKPSAVDLVAQLTRDLAPDREAASSSSALRDTDAADAEIILGTK